LGRDSVKKAAVIPSFKVRETIREVVLSIPESITYIIVRRVLQELNLEKLSKRNFFESDILIKLNIIGGGCEGHQCSGAIWERSEFPQHQKSPGTVPFQAPCRSPEKDKFEIFSLRFQHGFRLPAHRPPDVSHQRFLRGSGMDRFGGERHTENSGNDRACGFADHYILSDAASGDTGRYSFSTEKGNETDRTTSEK
jgi:hypothetical protein